MKKFNRNTSIILIVLFVLVTSYAAIDLLSLPTEILEAIDISENSDIKKAQKVAFDSYIVLVVDFFIVLLLIFMFSMNNLNHMADNIVYIEREKKSEDEDENRDGNQLAIDDIFHDFTSIASGNYDSSKERFDKLLSFLCNTIEASSGALYKTEEVDGKRVQEFISGYAFFLPESGKLTFEFGEGLVGQAAISGQEIVINNDIPQGYIKVISGLGESSPNNLVIIPIKMEDSVNGILEIAGFKAFSDLEIDLLRKASSYFFEGEDISTLESLKEEI